MIDPITIVGLFKGAFDASKQWTTPETIAFDNLDDATKENAVQNLAERGHQFFWARETRLRQLEGEGWKPVIQRDGIGRPSIFVDRLHELVLLHRPKTCPATARISNEIVRLKN